MMASSRVSLGGSIGFPVLTLKDAACTLTHMRYRNYFIILSIWMPLAGCPSDDTTGSDAAVDAPLDSRADSVVAPRCGDGDVDDGEQCDDGDSVNSASTPDACRLNCMLAACGDDVVDEGEECDEGLSNGEGTCSTNCLVIPDSCGNGTVDEMEECDDGPVNSNETPDACRTSCRTSFCGDSVTDTGEECDDGTLNGTDASVCEADCTTPLCGNGEVNDGETCDGTLNASGESVDCRIDCSYCGDGVVDTSHGESCDEGAANSDDPATTCLPTCERVWRFVSIPDFLNGDIGDVSALSSTVNSTNPAHEAAIAYVLDDVASHNPDFVLVAGDMVNGYWIQDRDDEQVFGPVDTRTQQQAATEAAAELYYTQWKERFDSRGLTVHTAIGDHEIGDNPWPANGNRAVLVPRMRELFGEYFTSNDDGTPRYAMRPVGTPYEGSAYAFRNENALFVTVDPFRQDSPTTTLGSTGSVSLEVSGEQLDWVDTVLQAAAADPTIEHVFVQGHAPILGPVRAQNSSNLSMVGGATSPFWTTMALNGVDMYLCGEVHHMTALNANGVEQVSHGGIMGYARNTNYMVATVYPDRVVLELRWIQITNDGSAGRLWQTGSNRPAASYALDTSQGFVTAGTLTIDKSSGAAEYRDRTGFFQLFDQSRTGELLTHYSMEDASGGRVASGGSLAALGDLVLMGTPTFGPGVIGNAINLPGSAVASAPVFGVAGNEPRTIAFWVRSSAGTGLHTLVSYGVNGSGTKWDIDIDANNGGIIEIGVGSGRTNANGTTSVTDGEWHHVATVMNNDGATIDDALVYVDGQVIGSTGNGREINTSNGPLALGRSANGPTVQVATAELDDLGLWSRALNGRQVLALRSFATSVFQYDTTQVEQLFLAYAEERDVTIDGETWTFTMDADTTPGALVLTGSTYTLQLGNGDGSGFTRDI